MLLLHTVTLTNVQITKRYLFYTVTLILTNVYQGRRRLLESGTAIEQRRCSPNADGTRGGGSTRGGLGDLPRENFVIQDD